MAANTTAYKNKLKRTIKTAMHALKLDDATYRDMLEQVSLRVNGKQGKRSIKNMTLAELNAVIDEMRSKGFEVKRGKTADGKNKSASSSDDAVIARPMLGKITALWITMYQQGIVRDSSDNAMNAFGCKLFNKERREADLPLLINIRSASDAELWRLIETLKSWQKRELDKLHPKTDK